MPRRLSDIPETKSIRLSDIPDAVRGVRLSDIPEQKSFLAPEDPEAPYRFPKEPISPIFKAMGKGAEFVEKIAGYGKRGAWAGLGALTYPFKSTADTIFTPATQLAKALEPPTMTLPSGKEVPVHPWFPLFGGAEKEVYKEKRAKELKEVPSAALTGLKSWLHFRESPEGAKVGRDFTEAYWEGVTGERQPAWFNAVTGIEAEFTVVPYAVGKLFKLAGMAGKAIPFTKGITARQKQLWRRLTLRSRARAGARIEESKEIGRSVGRVEAKKIADELSVATGTKIGYKAVQKRLAQIVSGGITTRQELAAKANPIIQEFQSNARLLRKYGILAEETYLTKLPKRRIAQLLSKKKTLQAQLSKLAKRKFPGRANKMRTLQAGIDDITTKVQQSYGFGGREYFPRMYAAKEAEAVTRGRFPFAKKRIRAPYAKKRMDIPEDVRRAMGEIKEVPYPITKRLIQEGADIETAKLFAQAKRVGFASKVAKPGWKKLPDTKAYGALKNNFVPNRVYDDITGMVEVRTEAGQLFDLVIGNWKAAKTVWNPSLHFRNNFSNTMLLDLSGTHYGRQARLATKAIKEIRANSKEYQFAKNMIMRTTMSQGEILEGFLGTTRAMQSKQGIVRKALNAASRYSSKIHRQPSKAYAYEEFWGKFIKFLEQRETGKSPMAAFEIANKTLFDYTDLAAWEIKYARRIMPFYTFPRKAIPRVLESIAERPHTFAKYPLLASTMTKFSLAKLDIKSEDYEQLKADLPEYMQRGSYILMPYRDANGDLRFFDWTYIIPWGPIAEAQERGILQVTVTNPLMQVASDIMRNKDSFLDRKIWDDAIPERLWTPEYRAEQNWKKTEHIWRTLAPSLAYKGIYWDKLQDAAAGAPMKSGKKRLLPETIAHTVFGLRTQAIDPQRQALFSGFDTNAMLKELTSKMNDITIRFNAGNITEEDYEKRKEIYLEQARKVISDFSGE